MINEKNIVIQQIDELSRNFYNYDNLINCVNNINFKNKKIGSIFKFNYLSYVSVYSEIVNNNKYHLLLNDGSIICFYYQFDCSNNIQKHSLYYIPMPSENIIQKFGSQATSSIDELSPEILVELYDLLEKCIRIDYDLEGKKNFTHTNVHLHYGINEDKIRFPIYSKVYPEEFVYFILKYVYESDDERLEKLNLKEAKSKELEDFEMNRFYLNNILDSK